MAELTRTLQYLRSANVFTAMVYLQEAHADDLWPLGYGIRSHSSLTQRLNACRNFLEKHVDLQRLLQTVAVDTMDDRFLHTYGAWPERYFVVELSGRVIWASPFSNNDGMGGGASSIFQNCNV